MYGTIARMRPKPGQTKAIVAMMEEWERTRRSKIKGAVATYVYKPDRKPDELVMAVVFQDKKTYRANADDPEQDKWYQRFRALLQADPEWEDGEIIFRHGMALMTGEQPSLAQAAAMIDVAVEAGDRFYPAFDFLVRGSKSPQDAIAACMFETVGEA